MPSIEELTNGFYKEQDILDQYASDKFNVSSLSAVNWIAIDPGIKSILTGWNMNSNEEICTLKQNILMI